MNRLAKLISVLLVAIFLTACGTNNEEETDTQNQENTSSESNLNNEEQAVETNATKEEEVLVSLENTEGAVVGTATLKGKSSGVSIHLEAENLPPGTHGFHIHEAGVCEPPTFESAGSHYNPTGAKHGFDHPEGPHAGDLENIVVSDDGTVNVEVMAEMVTLEQGAENTLYTEDGTSLIIHSDADDYISQPSGNAGDRIACGVIGE
ncbi:superoxide dismutase family protein [Oceanobacillus rekensis]|uniref:superoxide dismutase family protein n=1 Tax=Oceanobacillus rekensis TaxID=937927 RepID=UPI000B4311FF|nr:superoxide dismutase family protein [Oceanobacillus rekensis]